MKNGSSNGMACTCDRCGCGYGGGRSWMFFLLRTLVTIIILMFVFWFGVAAGRLSGRADSSDYGYGGMMRGAWPSSGGPAGMMRILGATSTPSATGGAQSY